MDVGSVPRHDIVQACALLDIHVVAQGDESADLDLSTMPPPDLVVENDVTRKSIDRLKIYAALGVPEVWRYDTRALTCHLLQPNGVYSISPNSRAFPTLPMKEFADFVAGWSKSRENAFIQSFRQWIREHVR